MERADGVLRPREVDRRPAADAGVDLTHQRRRDGRPRDAAHVRRGSEAREVGGRPPPRATMAPSRPMVSADQSRSSPPPPSRPPRRAPRAGRRRGRRARPGRGSRGCLRRARPRRARGPRPGRARRAGRSIRARRGRPAARTCPRRRARARRRRSQSGCRSRCSAEVGLRAGERPVGIRHALPRGRRVDVEEHRERTLREVAARPLGERRSASPSATTTGSPSRSTSRATSSSSARKLASLRVAKSSAIGEPASSRSPCRDRRSAARAGRRPTCRRSPGPSP